MKQIARSGVETLVVESYDSRPDPVGTRVQATPTLQLLLAQLGSEFSYHQVQRILVPYCKTPPGHATIQKQVASLGKARDQEEEEAVTVTPSFPSFRDGQMYAPQKSAK